MKTILMLLGFVASVLIVVQLVMGLLIRNGEASPGLRAAHFHSGTLMVVVALVYIGLSLYLLLSRGRRQTS
jgi:hypothetical protein